MSIKAGVILSIAFVLISSMLLLDKHYANMPKGYDTIAAGNGNYSMHILTTQAGQEKGLGGEEQLDQNVAMLFWYPHEAERCFWMKDMRFPIDIIWIDGARKITHIEQNLQPESYPRSYCAQARGVLEINAGEVSKQHIAVGQIVRYLNN